MAPETILLLAAPIIVIQLGLMIWALIDLERRPSVRGGNKIVWALIVVFASIIGPVLYFLVGREEA